MTGNTVPLICVFNIGTHIDNTSFTITTTTNFAALLSTVGGISFIAYAVLYIAISGYEIFRLETSLLKSFYSVSTSNAGHQI